jgi:hypothetical protein
MAGIGKSNAMRHLCFRHSRAELFRQPQLLEECRISRISVQRNEQWVDFDTRETVIMLCIGASQPCKCVVRLPTPRTCFGDLVRCILGVRSDENRRPEKPKPGEYTRFTRVRLDAAIISGPLNAFRRWLSDAPESECRCYDYCRFF